MGRKGMRASVVVAVLCLPIFNRLVLDHMMSSTDLNDQVGLLGELSHEMLMGALIYLGMSISTIMDGRLMDVRWLSETSWRAALAFLVSVMSFVLLMITSLALAILESARAPGSGRTVPIQIGSLSAVLFGLSVIIYFTVATAFDRYNERIERGPASPKNGTRREAMKQAGRWILLPVVISIGLTALTYLITRYQGGMPSHATVFAAFVTLLLAVKQKTSSSTVANSAPVSDPASALPLPSLQSERAEVSAMRPRRTQKARRSGTIKYNRKKERRK
jgi:hypothetical protein